MNRCDLFIKYPSHIILACTNITDRDFIQKLLFYFFKKKQRTNFIIPYFSKNLFIVSNFIYSLVTRWFQFVMQFLILNCIIYLYFILNITMQVSVEMLLLIFNYCQKNINVLKTL